MKVFLDEGVPQRVARYLLGQDVKSVRSMGLKGTHNGKLLAAVERAGFEAMLTNDKNIEAQQQSLRRLFAVLVLSATNWPVIEPHVGKIAKAVDNCKPGTVLRVECGRFYPEQIQPQALYLISVASSFLHHLLSPQTPLRQLLVNCEKQPY